jgi:hypothetical protein
MLDSSDGFELLVDLSREGTLIKSASRTLLKSMFFALSLGALIIFKGMPVLQ